MVVLRISAATRVLPLRRSNVARDNKAVVSVSADATFKRYGVRQVW